MLKAVNSKEPAPEPDVGLNPTLKAFAVVEYIARNGYPVPLSEVVQQLGLPKPSAHRILAKLEGAGLLVRDLSGRGFVVGPRLLGIGLDIVSNGSLRTARHAILQKLVDVIGETCNLTMPEGSEVMYLDRIETDWPLRLHLQPGARVPLHCTASGKLFLSQLEAAARHELIRNLALSRHTENTITDPAVLHTEIERLRARGMGIDNEEHIKGIVCVAVPVHDPRGRCVAAIAAHAPVARVSMSRALGFVPRLRQAAREMERTLAPHRP